MKKRSPDKKSGNGREPIAGVPANLKVADNNDNGDFLVVGIGASAGGVAALKSFFEKVAKKSGMAYVVILHLSPDYESRLAEVLQVVAKVPVTQVSERTLVEPDHVYVVPPNKSLVMEDGHIGVLPLNSIEARRAPIDIFFRTLAESHHGRAVAVVLSGSGADGSMGIKRVKENGGVTFVQNPREAEFNEMPRSSIATDLIDAILPAAEIPGRIMTFKQSLGTVEIPDEATSRADVQQKALREIFTQLRLRTGHDFTNYKRATILRRIERRINVRGLPDLPSYAAFLVEHPQEAQSLLKDLLISVTNFFRDKKAWDALDTNVVSRIVAGKKHGDPIRVWVLGCATGEEAYSLAMLFAEHTAAANDPIPVQIFATDIDEQAIATAREGRYTINDAADVSPERLRRFFNLDSDGYRVRREIRETVLFANHNALKDPPFSRLDMVSCRNMLIYLNGLAQERIMETLHFALAPGGYLFIGSSESVDGASDLYVPVDKENHIFQTRQVAARPYPIPTSGPNNLHFEPTPTIASKVRDKDVLERITYSELHLRLLEEFAPPSVVVNEDGNIVHLSNGAGRYMRVGGGELTNNLVQLVHPDLRLDLRSALFQAGKQTTNVEARGLKLSIDGHIETVNVMVRPVLGSDDTSRGFALVLFEPAEDGDVTETVYSPPEPLAQQLEEELVRSKAQLRASLEHSEVQTEELRASNEELQAMNEELRSAAEELETSKEELQSINEELVTVNQELKVKIEELSQSNNNFQNLLNSTDIAIVFLDRGLRVNLFSPATRAIFNLLPADLGRPLTDITSKLEYDGVVKDAEMVLEKLQTVTREVRTKDGSIYVLSMLPYRTSEDVINGVVMTLVDITALKSAQKDLQERAGELARFNNAMVGREERMIGLKKEVNELAVRLNEPERYPLEFEN